MVIPQPAIDNMKSSDPLEAVCYVKWMIRGLG